MNWFAPFSKILAPRSNRGRIVLWALVISMFFGLSGVGRYSENLLRDLRASSNRQAVSGDIVLVAIDNRSLDEFGSMPWPRANHAKLVERLHRLGARRIYFNILFAGESDRKNDQALINAARPLGRSLALPALMSLDPITGEQTETFPMPELRDSASLVNLRVQYDMFGAVRRVPYSMKFRDGEIPSLAAEIAGLSGESDDFLIDYSFDPGSVPKISAADVINGEASTADISGKDVVVGVTYQPFDDAALAPSYSVIIPGAYFHILGAETLRAGAPAEYNWIIAFVGALLVVGTCAILNRRVFTVSALSGCTIAFLLVPVALEANRVFVETVPAIFFLLAVGVGLGWAELRRMYRLRGVTNQISGLPNLSALHERDGQGRTLVAARVHNYAAITSTLPADAEKALVQQIAKRLMVGLSDPLLYQGDEGIFAWFSDGAAPHSTGAHLEALHTLFRSPISIQDQQFDLRITFGFDTEFERSVANRLASALVAADDAATAGRKWKEYDPTTLEDAAWKLSLLSQLDTAIDAGDLWVAYQPKLDIKTGKIIGAEALARWTHPEKGPISPVEFVLAAEQNDRIEKLTRFVLEHSIRAGAVFNRHSSCFNVAVNLSARLINDPLLVNMVTSLLAKHGLDAQNLTLEVTETAALSSTERNLETLQELRDLGVNISVDDYGTGMSTLDYLQRIPANEIKIDRSFIAGMRENQGTRVMVNSTVQLAHSLGQKVVAEGVEDSETLEELRLMNCDLAQGYLIGRPMTFRALSKQILGDKRSRVA